METKLVYEFKKKKIKVPPCIIANKGIAEITSRTNSFANVM